jgi:hypothetical protein
MAWYYGTYQCKHEGRINIIGPGKERQWKIDREFSGLCPECAKIEREKQLRQKNEEAAKASAEMELPELTGSEKQVAWATSLRMDVINKITETFSRLRENGKTYLVWNGGAGKKKASLEFLSDALDFAILSHTDAKFWIDSRRFYEEEFLTVFADKFREYKNKEIPDDVREEIESERVQLTVSPKNAEKSGVVIIKLENNSVSALYIKDDLFRKIVKEKGYSWSDGAWRREITQFTGLAEDRCAEIGNVLLANGFTVQFPTLESKEKAILGSFIPECKRWIKWDADYNKLSISWKGHNDTLFQAAKKLPGAYWRYGSMKVSVEFWKEVQDFAEIMGFQFSARAVEKIEKYKMEVSKYQNEAVSEAVQETVTDEERLRKELEKGGVIEDLKDEVE